MGFYNSPYDIEGRDEPVIVVADLGNQNIKVTVLLANGKQVEFIMPHGVVFYDAYWDEAQRRGQMKSATRYGQSGKTQVFNMRTRNWKKGEAKLTGGRGGKNAIWQPFQIGEKAAESSENRKLIRSDKYELGYFDALLNAALLEALPDGHNNILLFVAHPATHYGYSERIRSILAGTYQAEKVDGSVVTHHVEMVATFEEGIAAAWNWWANRSRQKRNEQGQFMPRELPEFEGVDQMIVVELGGSIGHIGYVHINTDSRGRISFEPVEGWMEINGGIIDMAEQMRQNLKGKYMGEPGFEWVTRAYENKPLSFFIDLLLKKSYAPQGDTSRAVDLTEIANRSIAPIQDMMRKYQRHFYSGDDAGMVLLTGGAMRELGELVKSKIGHRQMVYSNPNPNEMVFDNVRGGLIVGLSMLDEDRELPIGFQKMVEGRHNA